MNVYSSLYVSNLRVSGFNCAIWNYGYVNLNNMTFLNNKLKYLLHDDQAGCICNFGILKCVNCTFKGNKGNWGGAIYSAHVARAFITECTFEDNVANDKNGVDIYNFNYGQSTIINAGGSCSNFKIATGYLPPKWKADVAEIGNVIVSIASGTIISFIAGPNVGVIVGTCVGTFIGTSLHLYIDLDNAKKTQHYDSYIFKSIPLNVLNQFLWASTGAGLTNVNSKAGVKKENALNDLEPYDINENNGNLNFKSNGIEEIKMENNKVNNEIQIKEISNNNKNQKSQIINDNGGIKGLKENVGENQIINNEKFILKENVEENQIINNEEFKDISNSASVGDSNANIKHIETKTEVKEITNINEEINNKLVEYNEKEIQINHNDPSSRDVFTDENPKTQIKNVEINNDIKIIEAENKGSDNFKELIKENIEKDIREQSININSNNEEIKEIMESDNCIKKLRQKTNTLENEFRCLDSLDITNEKDIDNIINIFNNYHRFNIKMDANQLLCKFSKTIYHVKSSRYEQYFEFSKNGDTYKFSISTNIINNNVESINWLNESNNGMVSKYCDRI